MFLYWGSLKTRATRAAKRQLASVRIGDQGRCRALSTQLVHDRLHARALGDSRAHGSIDSSRENTAIFVRLPLRADADPTIPADLGHLELNSAFTNSGSARDRIRRGPFAFLDSLEDPRIAALMKCSR